MSFDNLSLLDATLDDLADLKKFEPLPKGAYRFGVNWEVPENDEFVIVQLKLTVKECLEIPGVEEDKFPEIGKAATFYMRLQRKDGEPMTWPSGEVNDQDQGRFKEVLKAMAPLYNPDGTLTNREMMEASEGSEVIGLLGVRASKKDPDAKFNEIKTLTLPE